jgi:hypothetical protein
MRKVEDARAAGSVISAAWARTSTPSRKAHSCKGEVANGAYVSATWCQAASQAGTASTLLLGATAGPRTTSAATLEKSVQPAAQAARFVMRYEDSKSAENPGTDPFRSDHLLHGGSYVTPEHAGSLAQANWDAARSAVSHVGPVGEA